VRYQTVRPNYSILSRVIFYSDRSGFDSFTYAVRFPLSLSHSCIPLEGFLFFCFLLRIHRLVLVFFPVSTYTYAPRDIRIIIISPASYIVIAPFYVRPSCQNGCAQYINRRTRFLRREHLRVRSRK